jgi:hypothetical protein
VGSPGIVVPHHFGNYNIILQNCEDVNIDIVRDTLVGNIEKSADYEHSMTYEQILDPLKLEQKFNARNKSLQKRMSNKEEKEFIKKTKI